MIIASEQPFNGPAKHRLTGGHCEAIVSYTFFLEIAWPLAQRSRMMDYKDLRGAKALSARLMPELQQKARMAAVTCGVGGVQATATYTRGVASRCRAFNTQVESRFVCRPRAGALKLQAPIRGT
jgi:hypothetical protein